MGRDHLSYEFAHSYDVQLQLTSPALETPVYTFRPNSKSNGPELSLGFSTSNGHVWVGEFFGYGFGMRNWFPTPSADCALVVVGGAYYWVNVESPNGVCVYEDLFVKDVRAVVGHGLLLLANSQTVRTLDSQGNTRWEFCDSLTDDFLEIRLGESAGVFRRYRPDLGREIETVVNLRDGDVVAES